MLQKASTMLFRAARMVREGARVKRKATADGLWRYAKVCRVANVTRPYLETIG